MSWRGTLGSALGAVVGVTLGPALGLLNCGYDAKYDAKVQCPRALQNGIRGPGLIPCEIQATRDRLFEFKKENRLTATCDDDDSSGTAVRCNGVTASGEPVVFKCDSRSCKYVPRWAW